MTHQERAPFLHVANGSSTTDSIADAGIPGRRSIWADPLYEGPVPAGLSDDELLDVRGRFHASAERTGDGARSGRDPVNDLREWRAVIARADYDELVLWFEHDLFDQVNLIQVLAWIRERVPPTLPVSLICIGAFPGRADFKGLGELTSKELAPLLATRLPVTEAQYALARRAWDAFRSPTPEALDALRHDDTSALPYLAPALRRLLQEYPWTRDGLSRSERRLLALAGDDGMALSQAFRRMHEGEQAYYITDLSLAEMAGQLSRLTPALLRVEFAKAGGGGHPLHGTVTLTEAGRSVLEAVSDRVAMCGAIDRWVGGVHLHEGAPLWRWDDDAGRMVVS